jgi:hypothetical protein
VPTFSLAPRKSEQVGAEVENRDRGTHALNCVHEDQVFSDWIPCPENRELSCVDRIRKGWRTDREGWATDCEGAGRKRKGLAEDWKRLQQTQRSGWEKAFPV